jgi:hypothetical protein
MDGLLVSQSNHFRGGKSAFGLSWPNSIIDRTNCSTLSYLFIRNSICLSFSSNLPFSVNNPLSRLGLILSLTSGSPGLNLLIL